LRFTKKSVATVPGTGLATAVRGADFPQLFGANRDARLDGPALDPDWGGRPPQVVWRQPIGPAHAGFAIVGRRALTLEQQGEEEWVTCYDIATGKLLWKSANAGHYNTRVAGEGPRTVPTVVGNRVFTLGATGVLRCVDLETGKINWTRELTKDAGVEVPMWGFASSPLVIGGKVLVSAGGRDGKSLFAYDAATGQVAWTGGSRPINYSSPFAVDLAGRRQILMFNTEAITAHDPATGAVLWEHPWGKGMPHVARPIPVGEDRVLFSSGYGVGSALLEIKPGAGGKLAASEVWKTIRFQAKFSNPVERGGYVYGVSDGIFACLDLKDGSVKWKDGRYGHGQGLLVGEFYLQMTEDPGDIVLLRPTPDGAHELARFHVFDTKTWNPIALSGDLLLVRNDLEAACIRLPLAK
jgi:outer membrane protein assembly factor BamB